MTEKPELNKNSLELHIMKATGGKRDPRLIKEFIGLMVDWLPPALRQEPGENSEDVEYRQGYNAYKAEILENLYWHNKKDD